MYGLDDVLREDAALQQEVVVGLQRIQHGMETARHHRGIDVFLVEVDIHGVARINLVGDAVEAGEQQGRQGIVAVGGRVRETDLDALGLRIVAVDRDAEAAERLRLE